MSDEQKIKSNPLWPKIEQGFILTLEEKLADAFDIFDEVYASLYNLIFSDQQHSCAIYSILCKIILKHTTKISESLANQKDDYNNTFLVNLSHHWDYRGKCIELIGYLSVYLNHKMKQTSPTYIDIPKRFALDFEKNILHAPAIYSRCRVFILSEMAKHRSNEVSADKHKNEALLKNCINIFIQSNLNSATFYHDVLERPFLEETTIFYTSESHYYFSICSVPDYLRYVEKRMEEEMKRVQTWFRSDTIQKVSALLYKEMIDDRAKDIIQHVETGFSVLLQQSMLDDLARLYRLFSSSSKASDTNIKLVSDALIRFIQEKGETISNDANTVLFIEKIIQLREFIKKFQHVVCPNDKLISKSCSDSFSKLIESNDRSSHYLALYIHDFLRKGGKKTTEVEVMDALDQTLQIYKMLRDKDVFEAAYQQYLAERLLGQTSSSENLEHTVVNQLTILSGHQSTSSMNIMLSDIQQAGQTVEEFQKFCRQTSFIPSYDLQVTILTSKSWLFGAQEPCCVPLPFEQTMNMFNTFYQCNNNRKKLIWRFDQGTAELKMKCNPNDTHYKGLHVTTYQACILLLFNDTDTFTYSDILEKTRIPDQQLQTHLLSLAHPKVGILKKNPNQRELRHTDTFTFNTHFVSPLRFIRVPLFKLSAGLEKEKKEQLEKNVLAERKFQIEAIIVRIMKNRKQLDHNSLIVETIKQINAKFKPDIGFIKRSMESLMDQDYIKRDENNRSLYHYIA